MKNFEHFHKIDLKLRFFEHYNFNLNFDCLKIVTKIEVFQNFDWNRDLFQNCEWNCVLLIRINFLEVLKKFKLFCEIGIFQDFLKIYLHRDFGQV